jgi:hypothetical protein
VIGKILAEAHKRPRVTAIDLGALAFRIGSRLNDDRICAWRKRPGKGVTLRARERSPQMLIPI